MLNSKNKYKEESLPVANHYPSHHPKVTEPREHRKKTKHSMDAKMFSTLGNHYLLRVAIATTVRVR